MDNGVFKSISTDIQEARRKRNRLLLQAINGEIEIYNLEDAMRNVAALEYSYNLALELAVNFDIEKFKKMMTELSYSVILSGEVNGDISDILSIINSIFSYSSLYEGE